LLPEAREGAHLASQIQNGILIVMYPSQWFHVFEGADLDELMTGMDLGTMP